MLILDYNLQLVVSDETMQDKHEPTLDAYREKRHVLGTL